MRVVVLSVILFVTAASCRQSGETPDNDTDVGHQSEMLRKSISEVLALHASDLMDIDGVNSVGQGECDGKPCISVGVVQLTDSLRAQIPEELDGYEVKIHEQGRVRAR